MSLLFWLRWHSFERPTPPFKEFFPFGEIRIGVDASYPPFAIATGDNLFGIDIDIGHALGKKLDLPVRFVNMGYDGLYDSLKADQVDILISALTIDYARSTDVLYTVPYYNAGLVLVAKKTLDIESMEKLSNHSLAFEFGSEANIMANRWLRRIAPFQLMPYETPEYALDALRLGLSDAALVDATNSHLYLRQHDSLDVIQTPVSDTLFAIALSTHRVDTWRIVDHALKELIDDKTINEILNHWL